MKYYDITRSHAMCSARVLEQFGLSRTIRNLFNDHINWLCGSFIDSSINIDKLRLAFNKLISLHGILRAEHKIVNNRDLLCIHDFDIERDYLSNQPPLLSLKYSEEKVTLFISHIICDLRSCFLINKDLEKLYHDIDADIKIGNNVFIDDLCDKYNNSKNNQCIENVSKWRSVKISTKQLSNIYTKEAFFVNELRDKKKIDCEEIYNLSNIERSTSHGFSTIGTIKHKLAYDDSLSLEKNTEIIKNRIINDYSYTNLQIDTFTSEYIYNFIKTDKIFNPIYIHLITIAKETPEILWKLLIGIFPMSNKTTKEIKVIFQSDLTGCFVIIINIED